MGNDDLIRLCRRFQNKPTNEIFWNLISIYCFQHTLPLKYKFITTSRQECQRISLEKPQLCKGCRFVQPCFKVGWRVNVHREYEFLRAKRAAPWVRILASEASQNVKKDCDCERSEQLVSMDFGERSEPSGKEWDCERSEQFRESGFWRAKRPKMWKRMRFWAKLATYEYEF